MAEVGAGSRLGPFVIGAEIARGGMGIVFRARQPSLERDVALKLIDPRFAADPGYRTRFLREARLAARVEHPHAVPIYDSGEADCQLFMAMRLIGGRDLGRLIAERSWLDAEEAVEVLEQIAGAHEDPKSLAASPLRASAGERLQNASSSGARAASDVRSRK